MMEEGLQVAFELFYNIFNSKRAANKKNAKSILDWNH
jgi:hypothetical protein